MDRGMNRRDE
jgi:hypothetical protein